MLRSGHAAQNSRTIASGSFMEDSASTAAGRHATARGRRLVPIAASLVAVVQNLALFAFGLKEGFQPLFFAPCAVEVGLCWLGWLVARRVVVRWCLAVLLVAAAPPGEHVQRVREEHPA